MALTVWQRDCQCHGLSRSVSVDRRSVVFADDQVAFPVPGLARSKACNGPACSHLTWGLASRPRFLRIGADAATAATNLGLNPWVPLWS